MNKDKSSDFLWKIVLAGDSFSGKTTIRRRAMGEHFAEEYISTVGADFSSYRLKLGDLTIGFQVWDLAGQDKYKYIRSSFYGGATGCFLIFDVTNPQSMKNLSSWVDEAIRYSNGTIEIFIICGNKIDLKDHREITRDMGMKYTKALRESSGLQCEYIETSALTGENIDIAFDIMAKDLLEREGISPFKQKEDLPKAEEQQSYQPIIKHPIPIPEPSAIEQPISKIIETIPSVKKTNSGGDEDEAETEKLIAEVIAVLDETDEIIIDRKVTEEGEKAITVTRESLEEQKQIGDQTPHISIELEHVLKQINIKLDSLTSRLKDIEKEITHTKIKNNSHQEIKEESFEAKELTNDFNLIAQLTMPLEAKIVQDDEEESEELLEELDETPYLEENYDEEEEEKEVVEESQEHLIQQSPTDEEEQLSEDEQIDQEQFVLESLLETLPLKQPQEKETHLEKKIDEEVETELESKHQIVNDTFMEPKKTFPMAAEISDTDLVDIPDEEPLIPIIDDEEEIEDETVIGTELSSAMISELKDISEKDEIEEEPFITQQLQIENLGTKNYCPICNQELKYIKQYKKFYCVKCGRYLI